ncbi:trehalose-phosphatase [Rahnella sikkimica]|uniref:trehalose-phosphatase n=1 Tax=Rahnella sikkimica TaxID=1805933 RepID=UPI000CF4E28B|nr:trehalose-phosphatase [Rahnella sikkimica]
MTTELKDTTTETPPIPALSGGKTAFFFDVDGTLAEICAGPDDVTLPAAVRDNLKALAAATSGAVALVSGRPVEQLDQLTAPLKLPAAGVHGAELRDFADNLHRVTLPEDVARALQYQLEQGMAGMPGTLLEAKGMAFALHYRQAPAFQQQVLQLAESAVAAYPELMLQRGKCVVEIKPRGNDKGSAITTFMQQAPFSGRIPVFVGDDLTDEKGFQVVNAMKGISVKVGGGFSHARYRLAQVSDVHQWLESLQRHLTVTHKETKS